MTAAARERSRVRTPLLCTGAAAWIAMAIAPPGLTSHGAHGPATLSLPELLAHNPPITLALGWTVMLVAMMGPLLAAPLQHVRARSFAARRPRAIVLFLTGYAAVWITAGAVLLPLALLVRAFGAESARSAALIGGVAILWQCSPAKQRCLNGGHRHPALRAAGIAADVDILRFAGSHALWCVGACWVLMTLPLLLPGGHVAAMVAMMIVSLALAAERMESPAPPEWRPRVPVKAVRLLLAHARMFAGSRLTRRIELGSVRL